MRIHVSIRPHRCLRCMYAYSILYLLRLSRTSRVFCPSRVDFVVLFYVFVRIFLTPPWWPVNYYIAVVRLRSTSKSHSTFDIKWRVICCFQVRHATKLPRNYTINNNITTKTTQLLKHPDYLRYKRKPIIIASDAWFGIRSSSQFQNVHLNLRYIFTARGETSKKGKKNNWLLCRRIR